MKKITALMTIIAIAFCGCSEKESSSQISSTPASRDVFAMDTYMNLKAYGGENTETALDEAVERISELEGLLSVTDENSDIWKINHAEGADTPVSGDTLEIIDTALKVCSGTDGALDITVYPVVKEWGFTTQEYSIPDSETIEDLLKNVDYKQIGINGGCVSIPQDFLLDLGSIAKGYTSDCVMEVLKKNGIGSAVISLGGNVQTLGKKPDGSEWRIAVRNPFQSDTDMCILEVSDKAVITSGNYERFFIGEDGKAYWHIIDAKDGYPADNGLVSVTIIGESGIMCDALSTALFVSGLEGASEYWRSSDENFDMILVTDDHRMYITEGIEESFTNSCDMTPEVIRNE